MIEQLADEGALDRVLSSETALLFKHSPICGSSRRARGRLERYLAEHPELRAYQIDVVSQRALSARAAERTGVEHESPQLILIRDGRAAWHLSHAAIRGEALEERLAGV